MHLVRISLSACRICVVYRRNVVSNILPANWAPILIYRLKKDKLYHLIARDLHRAHLLRATGTCRRRLPMLCPSQAVVLHSLGVFLNVFPGKVRGCREDSGSINKTYDERASQATFQRGKEKTASSPSDEWDRASESSVGRRCLGM